jgi:hypothetical protein
MEQTGSLQSSEGVTAPAKDRQGNKVEPALPSHAAVLL